MDTAALARAIGEELKKAGVITTVVEQTGELSLTITSSVIEDTLTDDTPLSVWHDLDAIRIRLQNLQDPSLTGGIDYSTRPLSIAITKVEEALHWLGVNEPPRDIPARRALAEKEV